MPGLTILECKFLNNLDFNWCIFIILGYVINYYNNMWWYYFLSVYCVKIKNILFTVSIIE